MNIDFDGYIHQGMIQTVAFSATNFYIGQIGKSLHIWSKKSSYLGEIFIISVIWC